MRSLAKRADGGLGDFRQLSLFSPGAFVESAPVGKGRGARRRAETSLAAFEVVKPRRRAVHERILDFYRRRGEAGATVHEVAAELGTFPSSVSGRLTELRDLGLLGYQLDQAGAKVRRGGAAVLVASQDGGHA